MTSQPAVSDPTTTVDAYLSMWYEADEVRRQRIIAGAWTEAGRYVDPLQEAKGSEALSAMSAGIQQQFPGHKFRRTSGVDAHHDQVRFGWELLAPDGSVRAAGIDVGEIAPDGRLKSITGFFGDLPAVAG